MRIKEIAGLMNLDHKEVIQTVETLRDDLTAQGHKLAKKLTQASVLGDDAVRQVMANLDQKSQQVVKAEESKAAAEESKKRDEEARRNALQESARRKAQEEAQRKADEQLKKLRTLQIPSVPPAGPAGPAVAGNRPAAPAGPPPLNPPVPQQAVPPQAPPAQDVPQQTSPQASTSAPTSAPRSTAPGQQRPPQRQNDDRGPRQPDSRGPRQYDNRGPDNRGQRPGDNRPPRTDNRPPRGDGRPDNRPPQRQNDGGPRGAQGGPRRNDSPGNRGGVGQATGKGLEDFAKAGLGPSLESDHRPRKKKVVDRDKVKAGVRKAADPEARKKAAVKVRREPKKISVTQLNKLAEGGQMMKTKKFAAQKKRRGKNQELRKVDHAYFKGDFTVGEFADKLGVNVSEVMKELILMGQMVTINEVLKPDVAELVATALEVEITIEHEGDEYDVQHFVDQDSENKEDLVSRPPVVTVMGHVDHGKTTLLDTIRKANVVDGEAGGITQHIGAYFVHTDKGDIVFLDTPGHEAFTEMRARGADVTDLVILVVAANDGVKPQTVEAINHAKAANVPIIVAINKIDVEGANPDRVKQELMRYEVVAEEFGGDTLMVEISAKMNINIEELLENVALQSEVLELKANPNRDALGSVVESHIDQLRGAVATVLVQQGTLRMSDLFVCGTEFGRVRAMRDSYGKPIDFAGPATPVEIIGISGSPGAGEQFVVVKSEAEAREIAERRASRRKAREAKGSAHISLEGLSSQMKEGQHITLQLIVKGDVQGSVEAICASLRKIKSDKVILNILHQATGPVGIADVQLADASDAIIIGFNVRPDVAARDLAESTGVEIKSYNIIYDLLEEIESAMIGMLAPEYEEVPMGRAVIKEIFKVSRLGNIAGCFVEEGTIGINHHVRVVRGGTVVWDGKLKTLRRVKDDAKEVKSGVECGIGLDGFNDIKAGDTLETYVMKETKATLIAAEAPVPPKPDTDENED